MVCQVYWNADCITEGPGRDVLVLSPGHLFGRYYGSRYKIGSHIFFPAETEQRRPKRVVRSAQHGVRSIVHGMGADGMGAAPPRLSRRVCRRRDRSSNFVQAVPAPACNRSGRSPDDRAESGDGSPAHGPGKLWCRPTGSWQRCAEEVHTLAARETEIPGNSGVATR